MEEKDKIFNDNINLIRDYFCNVDLFREKEKITRDEALEIFYNIKNYYEIQDWKFNINKNEKKKNNF